MLVVRTCDNVVQWWVDHLSVEIIDEVENTRVNFLGGLSCMGQVEGTNGSDKTKK